MNPLRPTDPTPVPRAGSAEAADALRQANVLASTVSAGPDPLPPMPPRGMGPAGPVSLRQEVLAAEEMRNMVRGALQKNGNSRPEAVAAALQSAGFTRQGEAFQ